MNEFNPNRKRLPIWPSECYGNTRDKRKHIEGYEVIYSSNFRITSILRILKKAHKFESSGKGYVTFDKAFDIHNKRLPLYINMTVFIRKSHIDTTAKRHNEFIWWIKN